MTTPEFISAKEIQKSGLLWFINYALHGLGVSLALVEDEEGGREELRFIRTTWEGFPFEVVIQKTRQFMLAFNCTPILALAKARWMLGLDYQRTSDECSLAFGEVLRDPSFSVAAWKERLMSAKDPASYPKEIWPLVLKEIPGEAFDAIDFASTEDQTAVSVVQVGGTLLGRVTEWEQRPPWISENGTDDEEG